MPHPQSRLKLETSLVKKLARSAGSVLILVLALYVLVWIIFLAVNPNGPDLSKQIESERWIATSHSWLDRISCRRVGICGGSNWLLSTHIFAARPAFKDPIRGHAHDHDWIDTNIVAEQFTEDEQLRRDIPSFVFDHAPLLYLHTNEQWWPTDLADFLHHVSFQRPGWDDRDNITLPQMDDLLLKPKLGEGGFLESFNDPESLPDWLTSPQNIPLSEELRDLRSGSDENRDKVKLSMPQGSDHEPKDSQILARECESEENSNQCSPKTSECISRKETSPGLRSTAPAFLITVNKANDTIDAFWFFFYAFNRGARVTGIQYGNHVGDWEHILVRFKAGNPVEVFLSAHEWGSAYDFDALEKSPDYPKRPVVYAGLGSHAHYATAGKHSYALPFGLLSDNCDPGYLWDPRLNLHSYVHFPNADGWPTNPKFLSSMRNPQIRSSWLEYRGRWGDERYSLGDAKGRNYRFAGEYKYLSGPTGPWDKNLDRDAVCEHSDKPCIIRNRRDGYVGPIKGTIEIESFGS